MHSITIENFRCFGEKQTARLAPLTLLVGENSTGKTSFLALLRALNDLAHNDVPNFKRPPYDLGSFDEIVHYRGGKCNKTETFSAEIAALSTKSARQSAWKLAVRFGKDSKGTAPVPIYQRHSLCGNGEDNETWITAQSEPPSTQVGTKRGMWDWDNGSKSLNAQPAMISLLASIMAMLSALERHDQLIKMFQPVGDSAIVTKEDMTDLFSLTAETLSIDSLPRVFPRAPIGSEPQRTYDPAISTWDPKGRYVPMLLAELSSLQPEVWAKLKQRLENFGRDSGLFDEIRIQHLGRIRGRPFQGGPFQLKVRKSGQTNRKGPWRNLVDVGYGVSQALQIIVELLRDDPEQQVSNKSHPRQSRQFLLQQPEVHLHPSAQAALGSLFCQVAGPRRQLIVETHSDHLMDRVRMDVRDGVSDLKPEDVSILFFERRGLDVRIHSLRLDEQGNVLGAPDGYRQFFMDEMTRSLWPERSSQRSTVGA
ncbi:MAG TPA: hypothetical protein DD643_04330 [Synechococcus sp. UBA8638]|nr:hypothetical protein [Synechococcus sp. UBA8638]